MYTDDSPIQEDKHMQGSANSSSLSPLAFLLLACLFPAVCRTQGGEPADNLNLQALWRVRTPNEFQQSLQSGVGFSFTYDGTVFGPGQPPGWKIAASKDGVTTTFQHASGLSVIRQVRAFPEFDALEYRLRFKNEGQAELPALAAVNAMDLSFIGELAKELLLTACGGGAADATFPPKDYAITQTPLGQGGGAPHPSLSPGGRGWGEGVVLAGDKGKPSRTNLPFFFIESTGKGSGIFAGIGWTGQWQAGIQAPSPFPLPPGERVGVRGLHLLAGMPGLDVKLRPGEEISSPSILLGCFRGELCQGSNLLRRLIRDQYAPLVGKERLVAPPLYSTWFDVGAELDEKIAKALVDAAAAIGQEIFLVDAGWYKGTPTASYADMRSTWEAISGSLGNWEEGEELKRFPSGLAALADYVRGKGMQMGLWFEPERVGPQSLLAKQHPDWVTYIPTRKWGTVDFGNPQVPEFFCGILDRYIKQLGLRYIRWDCNQGELLAYWAARDTAGRQGISQIRHLEGLHRVEDWVRQKHPEVILENCAGGGLRIDLDSLQRRHTIWISDEKTHPDIVRFHLEGLNLFLPGNCQMVAFATKAGGFLSPETSADIAFQDCFGGAFGARGRLHEWPQAMKDQANKHTAVFKKIRKYLAEDYYLLLPQARTLDSWSGWQFHDPKTDEGFVQSFRLRSPKQTVKLPLKGLDGGSQYEFTDPYSGAAFKAPGKTLLAEGLEFALPEMSSRVLLYRRVP